MSEALQKDTGYFKPWNKPNPPEKILVIRFHAVGDVAAALPACCGLRTIFPNARIDFLTGSELSEMVKTSQIFDNIYNTLFFRVETENSNPIKRIFYKFRTKFVVIKHALQLRKNAYDIVIDLQKNRNSKILLQILRPKYWSLFDKYSPKPHSTRVLETFHKAGFEALKNKFDIIIDDNLKNTAEKTLVENGWDKRKKLIVLNPAGLWTTRNWPIENYCELTKLFLAQNDAIFITLGDKRIKDKANILKNLLGNNLIYLSGKTTLEQAFSILSLCSLIISEDSGLAHMAWAIGVPLVLMLGSTRSDWTCHSNGSIICLNSSDLECGNCMQEKCKYNDVRCLIRYTPEFIYEKAAFLLQNYKAP